MRLLFIVAAASVFAHQPAAAQVAVSAALESDYRFRGASFSDRRPALTLTLSYDHPSGAYVGGSAIAADTPRDGVEVLGYIAYAGVVKRLNSDIALDVGVTNYDLDRYTGDRTVKFNYAEAYVGAVTKNIVVRGYFSPNYISNGAHTVYLDVSGVVHPRDKWRLFGHVGMFTPINDEARSFGLRRRYDARVGVAREFTNAQVSLSWTTQWPRTVRPGVTPPKRSGLVAGVSYFF